MKFVSKSSNLLIVLRPGFSAQPLTGTPAKPTVSVRFKDGIAEVPEGELADMMLKHPGFNSDFVSAEADPYAASRKASEPAHILTEMKYGTPVGRKIVGGEQGLAAFSPEIQNTLKTMAAEMAKAMLPTMVESTLKSILATHGDQVSVKPAGLTKAGKPKGRPGRKPKVAVVEPEVTPLAQEVVS